MTRAIALRLAATAAAVASVFASVGYVAAHPKDARAPLQPPVVRPSPPPTPAPSRPRRIELSPGVRATELPAITNTHAS